MKRVNNAFTLTELLVALGIIGILCAILLPIIFSILPNQNTLMAKRAYYAVQTVVAEMINDETCYPDLTTLGAGKRRVGFYDGLAYVNCTKWNNSAYYTNESGQQNNKFVTIIKDKLDIQTDNGTQFTTKDGMQWAITGMNYTSTNNPNSTAYITIDVNGTEEPNCTKSAAYASAISGKSACPASRTKGMEVFTIGVRADGRLVISPTDTWAMDAVKVSKDITEE